MGNMPDVHWDKYHDVETTTRATQMQVMPTQLDINLGFRAEVESQADIIADMFDWQVLPGVEADETRCLNPRFPGGLAGEWEPLSLSTALVGRRMRGGPSIRPTMWRGHESTVVRLHSRSDAWTVDFGHGTFMDFDLKELEVLVPSGISCGLGDVGAVVTASAATQTKNALSPTCFGRLARQCPAGVQFQYSRGAHIC
mmetsp:Transcript_8524/g.18370  ORF Transcript_8524/g.18370 Transcript_8524/m.18370 type:complete len:198 (-) Transcript_8524:31-624(-)